ncbi:MAG: TetR/AcrR family transcriptional regulator [Alphaproteobacteria bacterium]|nr:TetR/AcrR family transcriptional regulator [Alphaproteobacteria bacterium]
MAVQQEPQKTSTKERLIDTAIDLIWKSSYGAVSVDEICKAADVRKGSFYHFFPSKIDLAVAAMDKAYSEFKCMMHELFDKSVPPVERFEKLMEYGLAHQEEAAEKYGMVCGCPFVSLASEMAPQDPQIREKVEGIIMRKRRYYEDALRDMLDEGLIAADTDVEATAYKIYTFVMGQLMLARIQNSLEPMKRDLRTGLFTLIGLDQSALKKSA